MCKKNDAEMLSIFVHRFALQASLINHYVSLLFMEADKKSNRELCWQRSFRAVSD